MFSTTMRHADENKIIKHYQHGFRKGHSCETQWITIIENIGKELDKQQQVGVLILDFAKAFDTVPPSTAVKEVGLLQTVTWINHWLTK